MYSPHNPMIHLEIAQDGTNSYPEYKARIHFHRTGEDKPYQTIEVGTASTYAEALRLVTAFHEAGMRCVYGHLGKVNRVQHLRAGEHWTYQHEISLHELRTRKSRPPESVVSMTLNIDQAIDQQIDRERNPPKKPACRYCGGASCYRCDPYFRN